MKNLVVVAAGDESLHDVWTQDSNLDFDIFIVYYGDEVNKYIGQSKYYATAKGTKFQILNRISEEHQTVFSEYDAVFVPDDDLYISTQDISRFFELFHFYKLSLAQPSIIGWASIPITLHRPMTVLRYTSWVEIMCPCFSREAFGLCLDTFTENKTNWGLEWLWTHLLGNPTDKIAIIDSVIAAHTRPCFSGDTYWRNGNTYDSAMQEAEELLSKYGLAMEWLEYDSIEMTNGDFYSKISEHRLYPDHCSTKTAMESLRIRRVFL